jgi:hypothetical protein
MAAQQTTAAVVIASQHVTMEAAVKCKAVGIDGSKWDKSMAVQSCNVYE